MLAASVLWVGCSSHPTTDGDSVGAQSVASCPQCVTDLDCSGATVCAQFSGDTYCAATCDDVACDDGSTCTAETTYAGDVVNVCVPDGNACGISIAAKRPKDAGVHDTGARSKDSGPAPSDTGGVIDGGGEGGTLTGSGGTVDDLVFAIIGDTRPPVIDDTAGYPVATITSVFSRVAATSPAPLFGVTTGDYQFSRATGSQAPTQIGKYLAALDGAFTPGSFLLYPAMGNHECTGATNSNCGPEGKDGTTNNYTAFHDLLLSRIDQPLPYYRVDLAARDATWTAKLVFVAANYWGPSQASWLDAQLSDATTYTFVVRHESSTATTAPGVTPSEKIIKAHPLTMEIVGHEHSFGRVSQQEILVGNGGAPLTGSAYYGFALAQRKSDGTIQFDMINASTGAVDPSFGFAVKADGWSP
ncbi:MAG: hypothetical protein ACHREM_28650 [Polyangiales bacterium]